MDMALHRYGGGLSEAAVENLLSVPFGVLVRLVGAAKRAVDAATGKKGSAKPAEDEEARIIAELNAKKAAVEAERQEA